MNLNDFEFKTVPFKHQLEGIEYGLAHDKWLLADSMGLGKSKIVIDIADVKKVKHCLIICCKNGLKWNWKRQVEIHSYSDSYILGQRGNVIGSNKQRFDDLNDIDELPRFIITNIETLKYRVPTGEKVERKVNGKLKLVDRYSYPIADRLIELCASGQIEMIAVDEFHRCKNEDTEQAKQLLKIHSPIQIAITGTPVINSPIDIFMSLKWLGYEDRAFGTFKYHYCKMGGYNGKEILGYKHLEEITDTLNTMMLRRLKENEMPNLPDKIFVKDYVEMSSKQEAVYRAIKGEILADIDKIRKSANPLTEFIRLRQATGYTGILSNTIKLSAKLDRMEELVEDAINNGEKVVIFSNWTQITNPAYERLSKRYKGVLVTGNLDANRRNVSIEKFCYDDNVKFLIATIGVMAEGQTLTSASVEIFLDEPWDMETKNQAIDRCHRIGQTKNLTVYTLITRDTIDQRVNDLVELKGEISNILMNSDSGEDKTSIINYLLS